MSTPGRAPSDRSRASAAAGLVLLLLVALVAWRASAGSADPAESADPAAEAAGARTPTGPTSSEQRAQQARASLDALAEAWGERDQPAFRRAAGELPAAGDWADRTYDALTRLDVSGLSMRFLGERPAATTARAPGGIREFVGDVSVTWEVDGYRTEASTVAMSFGGSSSGLSVLGLPAGSGPVVGEGEPLPLWLAGELVARPGARCVGVDVDPASVGCDRLARVAGRDLAALLPAAPLTAWRVILPGTSSQASALLGRADGGLDGIAAVTTTVDASGSTAAPQVVVLNPDVFGRLGPDAAQLVVSHEAAHAATGAAAVDLPLWVAEGFADYAALRAGRVPVERAAGQVLAWVRRDGPPARLPLDADFSGGRTQLGRTYEAAWLAFRLIGERHGDAAVVAFYEAVLDGVAVRRALSDELGTTRAELTRAWQADLVRLAG